MEMSKISKNEKLTSLKSGDRIIFREEGTVSFVRCNSPLRLVGTYSDDKFFLGSGVNKISIYSIAELIGISHGLRVVREKSFVEDHLVFRFID